MKKSILCIFMTVVLLVLAVGAISCQKQAEPTLAEQRAMALEIQKDGLYDYNYNLVPADADTNVLTAFQRAVIIEGFSKPEDGAGEELISQCVVLGWIYQQKVIVPIQAFFISSSFGVWPGWQMPDVFFRASLLPDPRVDDDWQVEELGNIQVNEKFQLAVIDRANPIINASGSYKVGDYQDLTTGRVDKALYVTSQVNGRVVVERSEISEIYVDGQGRNLFSAPGRLMFSELGGLAFALRDGEFELVGFLAPMEISTIEAENAYIFYIDAKQVIEEVLGK